MPFLCYQGPDQESFGGRPIEKPKLLFYSAKHAHTHARALIYGTHILLFRWFVHPWTHTHTYTRVSYSFLVSTISHFIPIYNGYSVLVSSLNSHSRPLSPGPDYDTVGWDRRKALWPCLIKMVKSWRWIGWLILPQVPSQSPHLLA